MRKMIFAALAASTALATPAWGQTGQDSAAVTQVDQEPGEQEIVVTAQRREEKLRDVPISITSLGAESLEDKGVISTLDLTAAVPGLVMGRSTSFTQPTIRGVGSRNASSGDEANVATYIDGVYQADPIGTLQDLANVARVEVLKGPQGTLFGRNATGGAINIITSAPDLARWGGAASATYGRFDYYKASGFVSGPLIEDKLGLSISAQTFGDSGYVRNDILNKYVGEYDGTAVRVKTLAKLGENFTFQLNGAYSYSQNNVLLADYIIDGNSRARTSLASPVTNPNGYTFNQAVATQPWTTAVGEEPLSASKVWFVDAHFDWDLGFATLGGLFSYGRTNNHTISLADHTALKLSRNEYYSYNRYSNQELILSSPSGGRFTWILGVSGFISSADFDPLLSSSPTAAVRTTQYGQDIKAIATFAEGTYQVLDRLFLTGGIRYTYDERNAYNQVNGGAPTTGEAHFENVSKRGVVRYQFDDRSNVYFSYSEGFKSGTYNGVTAAGAATPVNPELITAYEAGIKSDFAPGWSANAAAYLYDYTDLQVSAFVLSSAGVSTTITQNAGVARIKGLELGVNGRLSPNLTISLGANLMSTKISKFPNASVPVPITNASGVPTLAGNVTAQVNANGNELLRAPERTLNLGFNYHQDLLGGRIEVAGNAYFSSEMFADVSNRIRQPAYEIVNGSVTWHSPGDRYFVRVFGENLTNQVYALGWSLGSFGDATQVAKPRWFGGTIGAKF